MADRPIPDELRAFYAEVRTDPYAHLLVQHALDSWCAGYEAAIRRVCEDGLAAADEDLRDGLRRKAAEWLADRRRESARQLIVALAQLGMDIHGAPRG